ADELAAIGSIGEDLLVARHRRVEHHLAAGLAVGSERAPAEDGAVGERQSGGTGRRPPPTHRSLPPAGAPGPPSPTPPPPPPAAAVGAAPPPAHHPAKNWSFFPLRPAPRTLPPPLDPGIPPRHVRRRALLERPSRHAQDICGADRHPANPVGGAENALFYQT